MILDELGIKPVINATGNMTVLGGTVLSDEVLEAMKEASRIYIDVPEAQVRTGAYIAKLVGAESAFITSGCAAAMALSAAACITKGDLQKMLRLPRTDGMANEVIVQRRQRNCYDHNLEIGGARLRFVGDDRQTTPEQLERAIGEKTAAVAHYVLDTRPGGISLDDVIEISHRHGIPVIVDAAAELPPLENLTRFLKMGSDLVLFAAGKDIGAPNDTGIILGRKDLVNICMKLGPHNYQTVDSETKTFLGRPMKTSKEDIFAVVAALKQYLKANHERRMREWNDAAERIAEALSEIEGVRARKVNVDSLLAEPTTHPRPASAPRVELDLYARDRSAEELMQELRRGARPIYTYVWNMKLYINPQCLQNDEERIVVSRVREVLRRSGPQRQKKRSVGRR